MDRGRSALLLAVVVVPVFLAAPVWAQQNEDIVQAATVISEGKKDLDRGTDLANFQAAADKFRQAVALAPSYSTAHYYLGVALYGIGRKTLLDDELAIDAAGVQLDEATEHLETAVQLAPAAAGPRLYLGRVHLLRSQNERLAPEAVAAELAQAETFFRDETIVAPEAQRADAYEGLGQTLVGQGQTVEGLQCFEWAIDLEKHHAWALFHKAQALYDLEEYKKAVTVLEELDRLITEYRRERDYTNRLETEGRRSTDQAQDTLEKLDEDYAAVVDFKDTSMWPEVHKLMGMCLHELHLFSQARASFNLAMNSARDGNTESLDLRTLIAREYLAQAEWTIRVEGRVTDPLVLLKAVDDKVTEVLEDCDNAYPNAIEVRGQAYLLEAEVYKSTESEERKIHRLEDARDVFKEACDKYQQARAQNLEYPEARSGVNYARCLAYYGHVLTLLDEPEMALEQFRTGLEQADPESWECKIGQAYAISQLDPTGRYEEVRQTVAELLLPETSPASDQFFAQYYGGQALYETGIACRGAGRASGQPEGQLATVGGELIYDAAGRFREASILAPRDARPRVAEAGCYFDLTQLGSARRLYDAALELFPPSRAVNIADEKATVLYRLAYCWQDGKVYDKAVEQANEALALSNQMWQARELLGDAYTGMERYDAGVTAYERAFDIAPANTPDQAKILAKMGHLFTLMGQDQEAELYILRALVMFANSPVTDMTDTVRVEDLTNAQLQASEDLRSVQERLKQAVVGRP